MSIMDMFKGVFPSAGAQTQQAVQTAQPGNLPAQQPPMMQQAPNGNPNLPAQATQDPSPFAGFDKLWETPVPKQGVEVDSPIQFKVDPKQVMSHAQQIDFVKMLPQELVARVQAGGAESGPAMLEAINYVAQQAFAQSAMTNTKVLEAGLEAGHQRMQKNLPNAVRKQTVGNLLAENNTLFSNPATAPLMEALKDKLLAQFPTASPQEIQAYATSYLSDFAKQINGGNGNGNDSNPNGSKAKAGEMDWSSFED